MKPFWMEPGAGGSGSVGAAGSPSCPVSWPTTGGSAGGAPGGPCLAAQTLLCRPADGRLTLLLWLQRAVKNTFFGGNIGVGLTPSQVDKAAVHMEITQTGTQLPQHCGHVLLPDRKARTLELPPHQCVELVLPEDSPRLLCFTLGVDKLKLFSVAMLSHVSDTQLLQRERSERIVWISDGGTPPGGTDTAAQTLLGEAEQPGAVQFCAKVLGNTLAQLQHNVDGLQPGGQTADLLLGHVVLQGGEGAAVKEGGELRDPGALSGGEP